MSTRPWWPTVATTRGAHEAPLPGFTAPSGLHVFVSAEPGADDDWQGDFVHTSERFDAGAGALTGIDHLGLAVSSDILDDEVAFFRTLFDLAPGTVEEFMEPQGILRSRALRPAHGNFRVELNVEVTAVDDTSRLGVNQVASRTDDVVATVRELRDRGVPLMRVPDNYYRDLDARFGLSAGLLDDLRAHHLL